MGFLCSDGNIIPNNENPFDMENNSTPPIESFKELRKPIPLVFYFYTDEGIEETWSGRVMKANPFESGMLFPNEIKRFYHVQLWQNEELTEGKYAYLSLEFDVWKIGGIRFSRIIEKNDRFWTELKEMLLSEKLRGADNFDNDAAKE